MYVQREARPRAGGSFLPNCTWRAHVRRCIASSISWLLSTVWIIGQCRCQRRLTSVASSINLVVLNWKLKCIEEWRFVNHVYIFEFATDWKILLVLWTKIKKEFYPLFVHYLTDLSSVTLLASIPHLLNEDVTVLVTNHKVTLCS